jgi:ribosomal protein S18 acetylase RimI-like enzyme
MRFFGAGRRKGPRRAAPALAVGPAGPAEWEAVARLLFQYLPAEQREARAANALRLFRQGEIEPEGILAARGPGGLCGALVCVPLRGASGLVWPPQALPGADAATDRLVEHALAWLRGRGAKLAQALLAPEEAGLAAPLERQGFARATTLLYLRRSLDDPAGGEPDGPRPGQRLTFRAYDQAPSLFQDTLTHTYEGTLDCPELNGVRDVAEIIDGHKAQGSWHPERWWLALEAGRPAGVVLLADVPEWRGWDVSYLGVVPAARGRGLGRQLTAKAVREARAAGAAQLTLAVDARNHPARRLYAGCGFESFERREVYLLFFESRRRQEVPRWS